MKRLVIIAILTFLFVGGWVYGQCHLSLSPWASAVAEDPNDPNGIEDPNEVEDPGE